LPVDPLPVVRTGNGSEGKARWVALQAD
jgi:hypothetical protein